MAEDEYEPATLTEIDFDDADDPSDLLRTVELSTRMLQLNATSSHFNDSILKAAQPMQPMLEARTQPRQVPAELLRHAQPTVDMSATERYEFHALIDAQGRITIPEEWRSRFAHQKLRVILRPDDE